MKQGTNWYSSYEKNNYGELFYSLMRIYQPQTVIELGTEAGYSAYHIARGLKANNKGHLYCYDLWEDYQKQNIYGFYCRPLSETQKNLSKFKKIITLKKQDAIGIEKDYQSTDILHVDLHNNGDILGAIVPNWINKVNQLIILEGGSKERDKVEWMTKFNKKPIHNWLENFSKHNNIQYLTFQPFPSLTLIKKK